MWTEGKRAHCEDRRIGEGDGLEGKEKGNESMREEKMVPAWTEKKHFRKVKIEHA